MKKCNVGRILKTSSCALIILYMVIITSFFIVKIGISRGRNSYFAKISAVQKVAMINTFD